MIEATSLCAPHTLAFCIKYHHYLLVDTGQPALAMDFPFFQNNRHRHVCGMVTIMATIQWLLNITCSQPRDHQEYVIVGRGCRRHRSVEGSALWT